MLLKNFQWKLESLEFFTNDARLRDSLYQSNINVLGEFFNEI